MHVLHLVRTSTTRDAVRDNLAVLSAATGALHRISLPEALVDGELAKNRVSAAIECLIWVADGDRRWPLRRATCQRVERRDAVITMELLLGEFVAAEPGERSSALSSAHGRPLLAHLKDAPSEGDAPRLEPDQAGWRTAAARLGASPAYRDCAFFRLVGFGPAPGRLKLQFENRHLPESRELIARWTPLDGLLREASRGLPRDGEDTWTLSPPPAPGSPVRLCVRPEQAGSTRVEAVAPSTAEEATRVAEAGGEYAPSPEPAPRDAALWACWQYLEAQLADSQPAAFFVELLRRHFLLMAPDLPALWERLAVWLAAAGQWEAAYRQLRSLPAAELSQEAARVYLLAASQLRAVAPFEQLLTLLDFDTEERREELAEALRRLAPARTAALLRQLVEQLLQPADALLVLESLAAETVSAELALPLAGWLAELAGPERAYRYLWAQHEQSDLARRDPRILALLLHLVTGLDAPKAFGAADLLRLAIGRATPEESLALLRLARQLLTGETLTQWLADAAIALGERDVTRPLAAALWLDLARARRLTGDPEPAAAALRRAYGLAADDDDLRAELDRQRERLARDIELVAPLQTLVTIRRRELERLLGGPRAAEEILPRQPARDPDLAILADPHARALLERLCGFADVQAFQALADPAPRSEAWGLFLEPPGDTRLNGWVRTPGLPAGARFTLRTRRGAARLLYALFEGRLPLEAALDDDPGAAAPSPQPEIE